MWTIALSFARSYFPNISPKIVIAMLSVIASIVILYLAYAHGKRVERAEWQIKITAMQVESDRLIAETRTNFARALMEARSQYAEERERSALDRVKILSVDDRSVNGAGKKVDPYLGSVLESIRGSR